MGDKQHRIHYEAITKPKMNAWVAQGKGPQVGQTMQRLGWQLARGPAATVVVDLEGTNGTQIQGSRWVVKGKLEEVRMKESELWGKGDLEVVFKNLDLGKFSFTHGNTSMTPHNMSRWRDGLDMGFEVMKPGGEMVRGRSWHEC